MGHKYVGLDVPSVKEQPCTMSKGSPDYFSFRFLPLVVLPETLSLLRFAWLADWVAVCQPGFYWRLVAYSYFRSCEGAYS